jgi:bifunctional non-homologous end joining protein LigD
MRVHTEALLLVTPATSADIPTLLANPDWIAQEKLDGHRRRLELTPDRLVRWSNREGILRTPPELFEREVQRYNVPLVLDGEHVGQHFYAFDLLERGGENLRSKPYRVRYQLLLDVADHLSQAILVVPTAWSASEKRNLLKRVAAEDGEGVVFKQVHAPYLRGRQTTQRKFKFWHTATVQVIGHNERRSVLLGVLDGELTVPVGDCSIPVDRSVPDVGMLIEVRYLYAFPDSKRLFQTTLLRVRDEHHVRVDQLADLHYKPT